MEFTRVFAISDIHGHIQTLNRLLSELSPGADDLIITLGDYVDGGYASSEVLDRLIALSNESNLVGLRGNHDDMMLNARKDIDNLEIWRKLGGEVTLRSYDGDLSNVPAEHWAFLESTTLFHETEDHIFVHAGVVHDVPMNQQKPYAMMWNQIDLAAPHCSGKTVICGHSSLERDTPLNLGHTVCIDLRGGACALNVHSLGFIAAMHNDTVTCGNLK